MSSDFNETPGAPRYRRSSGSSLSQMWQNPIFKLVVVVVFLAGAALAGVKMMSGHRAQENTTIPVAQNASSMATGQASEATPEYVEAVQQNDQNRAQQARAQGDSSLPTPMQTAVQNPETAQSMTGDDGVDPLKKFEDLVTKNEAPKQPAKPVPPPEPLVSQEVIQNMSGNMRKQMDILMKSWQPSGMEFVTSGVSEKDILERSASAAQAAGGIQQVSAASKPVVAAGSIYYGQMLVEANSDVPGPILAQVLTGPLAGGKAIGEFQTFRNHLVITFHTVSFKTKQVEVDAIAIDPNTTLGGVATEVDPRYFDRVLLPAAAAFVTAYGKAISETTSSVTVSGTGATDVTTSTQDSSARDAMFAGVSNASKSVGKFLDDEAAATKRLVRVAVGTPIGIFFTKPVCALEAQCQLSSSSSNLSSPASEQ